MSYDGVLFRHNTTFFIVYIYLLYHSIQLSGRKSTIIFRKNRQNIENSYKIPTFYNKMRQTTSQQAKNEKKGCTQQGSASSFLCVNAMASVGMQAIGIWGY
jgi:hypothetical protein